MVMPIHTYIYIYTQQNILCGLCSAIVTEGVFFFCFEYIALVNKLQDSKKQKA